jgi:hypothetical protein
MCLRTNVPKKAAIHSPFLPQKNLELFIEPPKKIILFVKQVFVNPSEINVTVLRVIPYIFINFPTNLVKLNQNMTRQYNQQSNHGIDNQNISPAMLNFCHAITSS